MLDLDTSTEFGARVMRRLQEEQIIWLTTVRPDGMPVPQPVWFLWQDSSFLIYSVPKARKLRNIANNPQVALSFNCTESGGDVIVFYGEASLDRSAPPVHQNPPYVKKYLEGLRALNMTPEDMGRENTEPIRVRLVRVRGF